MNNPVFLNNNTLDFCFVQASFSSNKMNCTMHFASTFVHLLSLFNFFSINNLSLSHLFSFTCKYRNNEHYNDSTKSLGLDFKRVVYVSEFSNNEGMEEMTYPRTC